jgi:hypothetical protein
MKLSAGKETGFTSYNKLAPQRPEFLARPAFLCRACAARKRSKEGTKPNVKEIL